MTERKTFTPRPYQSIGMAHMLEHPRCALWAGMGMGKTTTTLNAIDALHLVGETAPTLVCAPLRVARSTWPSEAKKWAHLAGLEISPIVGTEAERKAALRRDVPIYTTNYEQLPWLVEHFGARWPFRTVIADEATRLKGFRLKQGTQRARALGRVAHQLTHRFIELTGTPSPNGLKDLWGQAWFLDGGQRLGRSYDAFEQRWFAYQRRKDAVSKKVEVVPIILPFAQEQIQDRLRDICLTLDPKDWFDVKEPIRNIIRVELPAKARKLYRDMEREMFAEIEGIGVEAFNAASKSMKCLQLASGSVWTDRNAGKWAAVHDVKLDALESIVEEAAGMPVLVRYQWVPSLHRILQAFPKARHLDDNPQTEADWCAGKIPILVAHAQSCGHGLNLQDGGNIYVEFDGWWDLEHYQQITERIGPVRQMQSGYDRAVFHHHIIVEDTVDELVLARYETKREVQDILLDAMKRKRP